jgi:peptide deformylase
MKWNIVKIGNPLLRRKTRPVPRSRVPALRNFLGHMASLMRRASGVGLAANQAGRGLQAMVMECRGNKRYPRAGAFPLQAYLNPRILRYSKVKTADWEGCLSVPGFRGIVKRSNEVVLEAMTPEGRKIRRVFRGFEARVVQHEVDHLNGLFYLDRMEDLRSWTHIEEFNKRFKHRVRD